MANRWPIANGNWSDAAIWSGSLIPTAIDDVYANNRSVVVDQDITIRTLNNDTGAISGVTAGGSFYLTNGVRVQSIIQGRNGGNYVALASSIGPATVTISGSNTAYITGSITGNSGNYALAVSMSDASNLYVTGSVTTGGSSAACMGILSTSTGILHISGTINPTGQASLGGAGVWMVTPTTLIVTGSIVGGGGGTNAYGVYATSNSNILVQGNVTGGAGTTAYGIIAQTGSVYVNGQVKGGTGNTATGITAGGGALITISGSVSGSINNNNAGIVNSSVNTIIVTGSVEGGFGSACYGITNSGNGFIFVTGSVISRGNNSGIYSTAASVTIRVIGPISASFVASPTQFNNGLVSTGATATNLFTGPFYNTGSFNAVYAYRMQMIEPTSTTWRFDTETAGVTKTLYTSNTLPGVPQQTDVRRGTQYNFGLTGSLEMPDPTTVKTGVETDNTTGSAIFTAEDMFNVATQNLTTSGSIGNLLTGASTVQTVGATISSFKV
jgi:hypothetical protein